MPFLSDPLPFPESQAEVPECIEAARARCKSLKSQLDAARGHVKAIQSMCDHPKDQQVGGRDISGVYSTLCKVCGLDR